MKILKWLDEHFEEAILVLLLVMISCVELIQVVFRNLSFVSALTWAEEFCRFCWIWSVFISLPYTIRKGSMLRVSVLIDVFPKSIKNGITIAVDLITSCAMILLGVNSITVVKNVMSSGETSPAMVWPMWIVFSVMLPGFFLGFARGIQQCFIHIRGFKTGTLSTKEQTMIEAANEVADGLKAEGGDEK